MRTNHDRKLLILLPGLGAVSTTFLAGIFAKTQHDRRIIGSITQNYKASSDGQLKTISELIDLPALENLTFGAWDINPDNAYESALKANVLSQADLSGIREQLESVKPMKGVFFKRFVRNLEGTYVKESSDYSVLVEELRQDIRERKKEANTDNAVMIWCASTETYNSIDDVHQSLESFEKGIRENNEHISPSQMYAYASLKEGVPFANGAPNLTVEIPALIELANLNGIPVAGKDFKTGQTFMKTLIAPGLKSKLLGTQGWFSTNILGNKDGLVLNDPDNFRSKETTKLESLNSIFEPEVYPELYGDLYHSVKINYYPPRGDAKEGWDNIDIFGWMDYPMQIKINFLCRDSILAAPIVLDLALLLYYSKEQGYKGIQEWMSFYFKLPQTVDKGRALHSLIHQHDNLIAELTRQN